MKCFAWPIDAMPLKFPANWRQLNCSLVAGGNRQPKNMTTASNYKKSGLWLFPQNPDRICLVMLTHSPLIHWRHSTLLHCLWWVTVKSAKNIKKEESSGKLVTILSFIKWSIKSKVKQWNDINRQWWSCGWFLYHRLGLQDNRKKSPTLSFYWHSCRA